ncbi:uncharacterized protein LOC135142668 isoform X2 [Zophobas morio]|uniref:uncharacterized protein LOC135142668 isoform X1 n=1 Tax=Zophobas morio TaxID=2755281 RepID=UPI00308395EE
MATISRITNIDEQCETPENSSQKFKKGSGTTDLGKEYEHLYIANLILKLIIDDDVENFYLSSNDSAYGSFDDVVVEIKFKNRTETFAIQLKHVSKTGGIQIEQLNASSGNFSIEKYYKGFKKEPKLSERPTKMVLFTNSKLNDEHIGQFKFGKLTPCEQASLLSTRISKLGGQCYRFEENEDKFKEYGPFFKNLYLYTGQTNTKGLETCTREMFKTHFESNETVFREYLHFITQWSMKEGKKIKLNKTWMKQMITLCVLSPFIRPLSFVTGRLVNTKRKIFREAVSKFDVTLIKKNSFNKINSVWSNSVDGIVDMEEAIEVNHNYQLIENKIETKDSLYDKDATKVSKLMWLLGKSPLVVKGSPQVYQAVKICQAKNLIILDNNRQTFNETTSTDFEQDSTGGQHKPQLFQKLSDLKKHAQLYEKILTNFTYSLQGQKDVALKYLLEICEDSGNFITADDLVEMMEATLLFGQHKDVLPPSHIERKLTKILIDVKYLQNTSENTIVLVDCVADVKSFKQFLPNLVISKVNDVEITRKTIHLEKICVCGKEVSQEIFSTLCKNNSEIQFHHFRYLDNHRLEWMESGNYGSERKYINELERFRLQSEFMEYTIGEGQYFSQSPQNINIICADAGMGKSTLAKSLKNSSKSTKWIILIYARNHALHFRKHGSNVENFLKYIFEDTCRECTNPFHHKVFKTMLEQNQIQLIWDGLDEASDATQVSILDLVNAFSEKGVKQWLTSRISLRGMLENELDLMLAGNSKCLVGVIYKNLTILEVFIHTDRTEKDVIGRDVLEVACAWNKSYPLVKNNDILIGKSFNTAWLINNNKKVFRTLNYHDIAPKFYKFSASGHVCFKKLMILLPFLIPLYDGNQFAEEYLVAVLYYAIRFDCPIIYECIENSVPLKTTYNNISSRSILALALFNKSTHILKKVFSEERSHSEWDCVEELFIMDSEIDEILSFALHFPEFRIDVPNTKGQSLAHYACEKNLTKTLRSLIFREVNTNNKDRNGRRPIHIALEKGHLDFLKHIAQIDVLDEDGRLPLHYACDDGDLGVVEILLKNGAKVDVPDADGRLPLHYACEHEDSGVVDILLKNGANVDVPHRDGRLPIHYACEHGSSKTLELLVTYGAKLDVRDGDARLPIYYALQKWRPNIILVLVRMGAKMDVPNADGRLPIHYACEHGDLAIVDILLKNGAKVDVPDADGRLPIHYACDHGDLAVVDMLLMNGAKVNVPDEDGRLPIHYACEPKDLALFELPLKNRRKADVPHENRQLPTHSAFKKLHTAIIKALVTNGAKVNVPDADGRLPIHYACEYGSLKTLKILVTHKAKLDVQDGDGRLPIHYAFQNWRPDIIMVLVKNGAKVDVPDADGRLPIHYAFQKFDTDIIILLVNNGAQVDVPDEDGRLPIHYACEQGMLNMVELVATNTANLDVPDRGGQLPIHCACRNYKWGYEIILYLCKNGAKVDVPDEYGRLPIHYACKHERLNMIEMLATNGAKFDVLDRGGQLPMHYACRNDRWGDDIILFLCKKGAKVDIPDRDGRLPIHYACEQGVLSMVKLLARNGAKFDVRDKNGQLPMHYACRNDRWGYEIILFLHKKEAIVNVLDRDGQLPIHYAFQKFNTGIIILLVKNGSKVDVPDGDGLLPIHYACEHGSLTMVKLLATKGAKFDVPDRGGQLPIHYASRNQCGGYELISFLCKKGAKVDVPDGDGRLPIHYAFEKFNTNIIPLLVEYGAKVDVPDGDGRLPIHNACEKGKLNLVELLTTNGAKFDSPDRGGQLPMHYACRNDWYGDEIILFLWRQGAKVDVPDGDGRLPIHYACEHGSLTMVESLATKGAKFDVRDKDGQLPMHYACRNDRWGYEIILFLCKKGAKVDVPDGDGRLPIHYACEHGTLRTLELLVSNGAKVYVVDQSEKLPIDNAHKNRNFDSKMRNFLLNNIKHEILDGT